MNNPVISSVHFQLTGRCNLRCTFCGQQNGMFTVRGPELNMTEWLRLAEELPRGAFIMLWGGEPLICDYFDDLALQLHRQGFRLGIVTNGTLIDRHADVLNECIDVINISLDGPADYHNRFRGAGVFEQVENNIQCLRGRRGELVFLTTIADANVADMSELPYQLASLRPDKIVLQQLMYLSGEEIKTYRAWLKNVFNQEDPTLEVWRRDDDRAYLAEFTRQCRLVAENTYPMPVELRTHGHLTPFPGPCLAACNRCHVKYDGNVLYCTDFYGFSAGNVRQHKLQDIFHNELSERFRREIALGNNPLCRHCAWQGGL